ncbi:2-amino-4-hydroxy-6-hydroxymethyldihydropteridine diphosphokinase [Pullulanibacillus pueri]|uniref:2-amino-4-hydroxy-6-hydroxymethyldihydropteridine diphosphokinase n=1 Tax=Pullulanibacillus pueri TaxID=1437324 RepID=A0A8J3EP08_9BACL|nr:2-amino-4-hydroxy-6-hydroxymethyldihydropteridine diphosphokinase [Pullulanibacillus pueri]MBM7683961.1 2-amino-4-hydroxy-6-hydroxymethyldihydropteridine diphosphokinase [Pullulanibacillus pueri]GGH87960.1 2-amino-4-hydroxy-6-hydroxymethyldihydropteridine pyrophosphokinase [Pullulanibacillus pueri]
MAKVIIGMGSNLGDREDYLTQALAKLAASTRVRIDKVSSLYETAPYGPVEQEPFLNMAVAIETSLTPEELLALTQSIESELRRVRDIHWGPRTIDLDILIFDNIEMRTKQLILPHPEIAKRLFVLIPLTDIDPQLIIPGLNTTVSELINRFTEIKGVRLWKQKNGEEEFGPSEN